MNKAKTLDIEKLTRHKESKLYSTVSSTYHIWLCSIATDKVLVEKQEEIEILQEKITTLTLHLMETEEKHIQLIEKVKGKQLLDILLYHIIKLKVKYNITLFLH